jgi:2',3'-cyclic-nucleotide 2'-phosphodiesterase (5'-nucleotidase family)
MRKVELVLFGVMLFGCDGKTTMMMTNGTVIGMTTVAIDTKMVTTRVGEAAIGDWMMDTLLSESKKVDATIDAAVANAGAIRGGAVDPMTFMFLNNDGKLGKVYPAGNLTDLDVAGWFPFNDDHEVMDINGTELKSVLERSANALPPDLRNDKGGEFLQVAGIKYTIDCSGTTQKLTTDAMAVMTEGTRVTKIEVGGTVIYDEANAVDDLGNAMVRVVMNNFISQGLDGHIGFKTGANKATLARTSFDFVKKMQDKIKAAPIAPAKDGRITIVGDCGQPLTTP